MLSKGTIRIRVIKLRGIKIKTINSVISVIKVTYRGGTGLVIRFGVILYLLKCAWVFYWAKTYVVERRTTN